MCKEVFFIPAEKNWNGWNRNSQQEQKWQCKRDTNAETQRVRQEDQEYTEYMDDKWLA